MNKKDKIEWKKKVKKYEDSIREMSEALLDTLTPIIKQATEEIKKASKNMKIIEDYELIQDEENEKDT